jgi:hypothetical protein
VAAILIVRELIDNLERIGATPADILASVRRVLDGLLDERAECDDLERQALLAQGFDPFA